MTTVIDGLPGLGDHHTNGPSRRAGRLHLLRAGHGDQFRQRAPQRTGGRADAVRRREGGRGRAGLLRECSLCHPRGEAGLAHAINNKPLPAFLIRFQIRHGLGAMPAVPEGELSDAKVDAIIAYLMHMRRRG